jgi:hypothetical protein
MFVIGMVYLESMAALRWASVKQILRYVSRTAGYAYCYKCGSGDYAGGMDDH